MHNLLLFKRWYANLFSRVLMSRNTRIGIVTAAGYTEAERYYSRLHGLLEAVKVSPILSIEQKQNLIVMGTALHILPGRS